MKILLSSLILATSAFAEVKTETISVPMRDGIKLVSCHVNGLHKRKMMLNEACLFVAAPL
jgi:hypothetical protein